MTPTPKFAIIAAMSLGTKIGLITALTTFLSGCDTLRLYRVVSDRAVHDPIKSAQSRYRIPVEDIVFFVAANKFNHGFGVQLEIENQSKSELSYSVNQADLRSVGGVGLKMDSVAEMDGSETFKRIDAKSVTTIQPGAKRTFFYSFSGSGISSFTHLTTSKAEHELILKVNGLKKLQTTVPLQVNLVMEK